MYFRSPSQSLAHDRDLTKYYNDIMRNSGDDISSNDGKYPTKYLKGGTQAQGGGMQDGSGVQQQAGGGGEVGQTQPPAATGGGRRREPKTPLAAVAALEAMAALDGRILLDDRMMEGNGAAEADRG